MTQPVRPAPIAAVMHGQPMWGVYRTPFRIVNLADARLPGVMNWSRGRMRNARMKEWQHFAIIHPDVYITMAIVDAKLASTSFLCVFDRKTGELIEHDRMATSAATTLPDQLFDGRFEFSSRGYDIKVRNRLVEKHHRLEFKVGVVGAPKSVFGELKLLEDLDVVSPLVAMLPLGKNRPFYTHKVPCPIEGELLIGDRQVVFDPKRDLALVDVHKAYYPMHTIWRWGTFAGYLPDGRIVGANLTHNVIKDDETSNENALWLGDKIERLSAARFEIPDNPMDDWKVSTTDGRVSLSLHPEGIRKALTRIGPVKSQYLQPFGKYSGVMVTAEGERLDIDGMFGPGEYHEVWW